MNFLLKLWTLQFLSSLLITTQLLADSPLKPKELYQLLENIQVTMRDGVKLATDVYLPLEAKDPLPVILHRTPYNKKAAKTMGSYYAQNGYVFVAQDTRGRYASEGVWHWMTDDGPDGVDCAKWLIQQPWCNGRFGMIGTSYHGGTQHAMALEKAPGLQTVIPVDAVSNCGVQSMRNAGAFELRFWNWIMLNAGRGSRAVTHPETEAELKTMAENRLEYLKHLPLRYGQTPLKLSPEYETWLIEAMRNGKNDEFWAQNHILAQADRYKDIPVYLVGGWYDSWAGNTTANYTALSKTLKSPVYMIMGPWIHGQQSKSSHGQVDFGKEAAIEKEWEWRKIWYDSSLKEQEGILGKMDPFLKPVRYFTMGLGSGKKTPQGLLDHGGKWVYADTWPPKDAVSTAFYFRENGSLIPHPSEESISQITYQFDPKNPVPTIGGNISSGDGIMHAGAWDQRGNEKIWNWNKPIPLSARNDVVVFETAPLQNDVEVTGEIEVKLWVSSDALDTDFTAKLVDVHPRSEAWAGGFDLNITDGIARARFRESLEKEVLMEPGKIYPITIKLYPTSNVFKKGHRIRVDISSSNFPRFDINPNTGEALQQNRRVQIANNTIHLSKEHPSHILLPIKKAE